MEQVHRTGWHQLYKTPQDWGEFGKLEFGDKVTHFRKLSGTIHRATLTISHITSTKIRCGILNFNRVTGKDCRNKNSWLAKYEKPVRPLCATCGKETHETEVYRIKNVFYCSKKCTGGV